MYVKLWIQRNLSGKSDCIFPSGLWPPKGKSHSSGLDAVLQSRRGTGVNPAEGGAPWLLGPLGAAWLGLRGWGPAASPDMFFGR